MHKLFGLLVEGLVSNHIITEKQPCRTCARNFSLGRNGEFIFFRTFHWLINAFPMQLITYCRFRGMRFSFTRCTSYLWLSFIHVAEWPLITESDRLLRLALPYA